MLKLTIHRDAENDLKEIEGEDPDAADELRVLLQELKGDQDWLDRLTQHNFGSIPEEAHFNVKHWWEQQKAGNNLWRIKFWDLEEVGVQYRVIYAFFPISKNHYVLGIMPRRGKDFDYKHDDPRTQRILLAYDELRQFHR